MKEGEVHAPCIAACPVHTDTRELAELVTQGEYERALELLLEANPFSSVCGRICHHPCEQHCRRSKVDAPVGLMRLKRFVMETAHEHRISRRKSMRVPARKTRVAVVGSGPSGLTAACDLVKTGYQVVVFERSETPGGLLGNAVPRYRLPYSVVKEDIEDILAAGVGLQTNIEIGRDLSLDDLLARGFRAVLLSTGLSESRTLNIPGIDSTGVLLALPFLKMVLSPKPPVLDRRVVVIGGGNVAMDVARSARRLGVVKGLELRRCVRVFDPEGRFSPAFDDSDTATMPADTIIIAVGQRGDLTCARGSDLTIDPGERLACNPQTLSTSGEGVFCCGELLIGPASSVEAVRDGHRAARAIDHYLETGRLLSQPFMELPSLGEIPDDTVEKIRKLTPVTVETVPPETRLKAFGEIERGFTEEQALAEAKRCLACTTGALADEEKCQACGLCAAECPAAAIALKRFGTEKMRDQIRGLFAGLGQGAVLKPIIISYCCLFEVTSRRFITEGSLRYRESGIHRVLIPCVARLSVPDLLYPFELGADGLAVIGCREGSCLYPTAEEKLLARIRQAKQVLEEVGVEGERLDYWKTEGSAEVSWTSFWEISRRKLDRILLTRDKRS